MKNDLGAKTYLYPMPVLMIATYNEDGTADVMNAAWGGISDVNQISICLSEPHKTVANIRRTGAFTVSVADADHVAECDYLGIVSANNEPKKVEKAGFTVTRSKFVDAPVINELKMALECKLVSRDGETGMTVGQIINVSADESVLTDAKIDPAKLRPLTFDPVNNAYLAIGEKVGNAFSDGKKIK
ncbi:MAG: flavin reductase family protein [Clostridia bacterium]|nr:flavin reductase family protein [Clostridia bacterium]